jgi:hypothetical protein
MIRGIEWSRVLASSVDVLGKPNLSDTAPLKRSERIRRVSRQTVESVTTDIYGSDVGVAS